jgi:hypothetical protein
MAPEQRRSAMLEGIPSFVRRIRRSRPAVAGLGQVDVSQLLLDAQQERRPGLTRPGSPLRDYAPAAPLTVAATTAALLDSWHSGGDRRMIIAAVANTAVAIVLTGNSCGLSTCGCCPAPRRWTPRNDS